MFSISVCSALLLITIGVFAASLCNISSKKQTHQETRSVHISSILCAIFGILGNISLWTTYPVCHVYTTCGDNFIGDFYFLTIFDTYLLNKIFMYLSVIYRLFDTFDGTSHQYSKLMYFVLYTLVFIIFLIVAQLNISTFFSWPPSVKDTSSSFLTLIFLSIYIVLDVILSLFTLYLYIRPLSKLIIEQIQSQKYSISRDLINSAEQVNRSRKSTKEKSWSIWDGYSKTDYVQQSDWDFSNKTIFLMIKFLVLIVFAVITNIIFGFILVIRFSKGWYHADTQLSDCFLDISGIFHMLEILISCIVVYLNFKSANNIYMKLCKCCHRKGFNFLKKTIKRTVKQILIDESTQKQQRNQDNERSVQSTKSTNLLSADVGNYKVLVPHYATEDLKI